MARRSFFPCRKLNGEWCGVKILFSILIALVIPLFFLVVFVLSQYQKLAALRRRCQEAAAQSDAPLARQAYNQAAAQYNQARRRFPTRLVAAAFGFDPAEVA